MSEDDVSADERPPTPPIPSQTTAERLALIRYQLGQARAQSELIAPLHTLALNSAQDAVEAALWLIIEEKVISTTSKPTLLNLFDAVCNGLGPVAHAGLNGHRSRIDSLNSARVSFKHHGNAIAKRTLIRHIERAESFVEALTTHAFNTSLVDVSLLAFVKSEASRRLVARAETRWSSGDRVSAMTDPRLAYDEIVRDFRDRKRRSMSNSLYDMAPRGKPSRLALKEIDPKIEALGEWIENMNEWVEVLALGVDVRDYSFFKAHTPRVHYRPMGGPSADPIDEDNLTDAAFERCYLFVVQTGLELGESDFDFDPWRETRTRDRFEALDPMRY